MRVDSERKDVVRTSSALDLLAVEEAQRSATWMRATGTFFPGLHVRELSPNPVEGWMRGRRFGPGELWAIFSPPLQVRYMPGAGGTAGDCGLPLKESFSIMLQMRGSTLAAQNTHSCRLRPRDICLIDGLAPFDLEVVDPYSQLMFLRIPRQLVLCRHPWLAHHTAEIFEPSEPGATLLGNILLDVLNTSAGLRDDQCAAALVGVVQMLGILQPQRHETSWRVQAALAFIDSHLAEPTLSATSIARAQKMSRRRLDDLVLKSVGTSLTGQIWLRRLTQAASDLRSPAHASRSIAEIAFACGFGDTAHFTRAFKRHHGCTPREWRTARSMEAPAAIAPSGLSGRRSQSST
jgi:AraC family transcriptional regulator, positive regulator of tynA and feaB